MANEVSIGLRTSGGSQGAGELGLLTQAIERLNQRVAGMSRTSAKASRATTKHAFTMGHMLQNTFMTTVGGALSLGAAIRAIGGSLNYVKQKSGEAAQGLDQLAGVRRRLAQISQGDLDDLETRADELSTKYGLTREESRQLLFSARSEDFEDDADRLAEANPIVATEASAVAAGQVPMLFKGQISPLESVNALLHAARQSRLDFETLTQSLPMAAEGASLQGASPAETIALSSVLASRFKSGDQAATRIRSLATRFSLDDEYRGIGILDAVQKLEAAGKERQREFLKDSQEANVAFKVIGEEMSKIRERVKGVQLAIQKTGTDQSEISTQLREALDPSTEAGRTRSAELKQRKARVRQDITTEAAFAVKGVDRAAAVKDVMSDLREGDAPGMSQYAAETVAEVVRSGDGSPESIKGAAVVAAGAAAPVADIVSLDPERMAEGAMRLAVPGHMIAPPQIPTKEEAVSALDFILKSNIGLIGGLTWLGKGLGALSGADDVSGLEEIEQFTPEEMQGLPEGLKPRPDLPGLEEIETFTPTQMQGLPEGLKRAQELGPVPAANEQASIEVQRQLIEEIHGLREELAAARPGKPVEGPTEVAIVEDRTRPVRADGPVDDGVQAAFGNKFVPIG